MFAIVIALVAGLDASGTVDVAWHVGGAGREEITSLAAIAGGFIVGVAHSAGTAIDDGFAINTQSLRQLMCRSSLYGNPGASGGVASAGVASASAPSRMSAPSALASPFGSGPLSRIESDVSDLLPQAATARTSARRITVVMSHEGERGRRKTSRTVVTACQ